MKLYRFSPINSADELMEAISYVHQAAHELCVKATGETLPVAENIGIFAHYPEEYDFLISLRKQMTQENVNFLGKYYLLNNEIKFKEPGVTYKYLYIRKPDPYRAQVGDADFVVSKEKFEVLKQQLTKNPESNRYARIFPSQDLDLIELHHPDIDVFSYLVPKTMSEELGRA